MGRVERKFVYKWLSNTMTQKQEKKAALFTGTKFFFFQYEANNKCMCFKMNASGAFTHKDYLPIEI